MPETGKRTSDTTLALPSAAKAKPPAALPVTPLSDVEAIASSVAKRVGDALGSEIAKLGIEMHSMSDRLVSKIDGLNERVDKHDRELAEVKRIAEAARAEVNAFASRPQTATAAAAAGTARATDFEFDPLKYVFGTFEELSRRDALVRKTRELLQSIGKGDTFSKIEAPKHGRVSFVWFKETSVAKEVAELLRERQIQSPAGKAYWCSLSKALDQVQRSGTLSRATNQIRSHLDDGAYSTETLDIMWRQGQIACGRSIIAQLRGDKVEIIEEGWKKEFDDLPQPKLE
eukprot:5859904-Amphidinium_carterae.2